MFRLRINYTGLNEGFSVMHFASGVSTAQDAADAAEAFLTGIRTRLNILQGMRVDTEVSEVDVATGNVIGVDSVISTLILGSLGGVPVPQAAQVLFRWRTGIFVAGREIRGRTFVPGLASSEVGANGELTPAAIADVGGDASTLVATGIFLVYSPARALAPAVAAGSVWPELAVMRSRRD